MEPTRGLSPEIVPIGVATGTRGLSPEVINWQRYDTQRFFAPYDAVLKVDSATVTLKLTPSAVEVYGTVYFDAGTVYVGLTPSTAEIGPAVVFARIESRPTFAPPVILPEVVRWTLVHYTHDGQALGEVNPRNLDFSILLNRIGTVAYDIDTTHALGVKEHTSPYETDFVLFRENEPIMGGEHVSINLNDVEAGTIAIAGQDWGHWLERQIWPFDPNDPLLYTYLQTGIDMGQVLEDILAQILAFPNTLDLDISGIDLTGNLIDYKIEVNDTETIYSKITELAKRVPGFDFELTWDKRFLIYSPKKGSNTGISLVQGHNISEIQYTNNGPTATYTLGTARSASSQIGYPIDTNAIQYRRSMATQDFGDITDEAQLIQQTEGEAERNVTPHREITLKVVKEALDVWAVMRPGDTIHVDAETSYEHIDDDFRVVGMQCTPNDEGDEEWLITVDDGTLSL